MKKGFQWVNDREKLLLECARRAVYKTLEDGAGLALHFFLPKDFREGEARPAMLFFNGGAWDRGSVVQFAPHALYYVGRGAVCALVEYRNRATHPGSRPSLSHQDGRAAIRYVRQQAAELNVDPARVITLGAGAGANIAGAALLGTPLTASESAFKVADSRPNAAVLLSGLFDVVKGGLGYDACADPAEARLLSLSRFVATGVPPLLLIHGNADRHVPFEDAAAFAGKMERKKNPCRLIEFEGRERDFFNLNVDPVSYEAALAEIDGFLDEYGLLKKIDREAGPHLISWREEDY